MSEYLNDEEELQIPDKLYACVSNHHRELFMQREICKKLDILIALISNRKESK